MVKQFSQRLGWIGGLCLSYSLWCAPGVAQVIGDSTLSTQVNPLGNIFEITHGNQVGNNLFHSFSSFSVPSGSEAVFDNAQSISNIFGRVTGATPSFIDGVIRANGNANLTLINPNGITFGAHAQLDIGGSFLGSTAESLVFADGAEFSATSPLSNPLLSISTPIGLQFGQSPGPIQVQGNGHNLAVELQIFSPFTRGEVAGLKVDKGETLALIGGEVRLKGGTLTADSGRIEVGSVGEGQVSLETLPQGWIFGYRDVQDFQDITFRSKALADASGSEAGFIQLQGRNIALRSGSVALIQTIGSEDALGIRIHASESLTVRGTVPDGSVSGGLFTGTLSAGRSGDIQVSAPKVTVQNGATIFTDTFTGAPGGKITINAPDSLNVLGFSRVNPTRFSSITAATFGSGTAGGIEVKTGKLLARNGGNIASITGGIGGTGQGGDVFIDAHNSIELLGVAPGVLAPSQITAGTGAGGNAGNVTIKTQRLTLRNGGRVDASTLASGDAGNVTIEASESVHVQGRVPGSVNPSLINSSANRVDPALQMLLQLPELPSGDAGNLTLHTSQLSVVEGGQVTVRNDGSGNAGTLQIQTDDILLRDQGRLSASTISGQGGNIILSTNTLQALDTSSVSAEAGGAGMGGNISIASSSPTESIVLLENSDITANALMGSGGNIQIETQGLFSCDTCSITASSQLGVDGMISVVTPETDSSREGINLQEQIIDPEAIVVQACSSNQEDASSTFTITGRGGFPTRPNTSLTSEALISVEQPTESDSSDLSASEVSSAAVQSAQPAPALPPAATGVSITPEGKVFLTPQPAQYLAENPHFPHPNCQTS